MLVVAKQETQSLLVKINLTIELFELCLAVLMPLVLYIRVCLVVEAVKLKQATSPPDHLEV